MKKPDFLHVDTNSWKLKVDLKKIGAWLTTLVTGL